MPQLSDWEINEQIRKPLLKKIKELEALLLDCWNQFAYRGTVKGEEILHCGGLSTLGDVKSYLMNRELIHGTGQIRTPTEDGDDK